MSSAGNSRLRSCDWFANTEPTLGDGRHSGTSDSPSILDATPESAAGGGLSRLRTGVMEFALAYRATSAMLPRHNP